MWSKWIFAICPLRCPWPCVREMHILTVLKSLLKYHYQPLLYQVSCPHRSSVKSWEPLNLHRLDLFCSLRLHYYLTVHAFYFYILPLHNCFKCFYIQNDLKKDIYLYWWNRICIGRSFQSQSPSKSQCLS